MNLNNQHHSLKVIMLLLLMSSCTWHMNYMQDLQQGQIISDKVIQQQLTVGMHKNEVEELLGTPLLTNLNNNRWEYTQTHKKQGKDLVKKKLILIFSNEDRLQKVINKS